jgi:putative transposase
MKKSRFTDEQIIGFLKQADSGVAVKDLGRKHGFSDASFYKWRAKYGGMEESEARRLKFMTNNLALRRVTRARMQPQPSG